jgi:S-adenosylmethionine-dependent methyltransferase
VAPAEQIAPQFDQHADAGGAGHVVDLLLAAMGDELESATVLDCGGGTGRFAVPLAAAGAHVTVVDVSADALATLLRRAEERDVARRVRAVQGDVEALPGVVAQDFDLVLAHGVLDALDDPAAGFAAIAAAVSPGGLLSVLVDNPVAGVLSRALAGDLPGAEREVAALDATPGRAGPDTVVQLCAEHGLVVEQHHGIGIFRDLVPGRVLDHPGAGESLARLEAACARRSPFAQIASRVHLLARRDAGPTA